MEQSNRNFIAIFLKTGSTKIALFWGSYLLSRLKITSTLLNPIVNFSKSGQYNWMKLSQLCSNNMWLQSKPWTVKSVHLFWICKKQILLLCNVLRCVTLFPHHRMIRDGFKVRFRPAVITMSRSKEPVSAKIVLL